MISPVLTRTPFNHKTTFLITTHIVEDINIAKKIIILDKGRIIFDGVQSELLGLFGNKRTVEFGLKDTASTAYRKFGKVLNESPNYAKMEVSRQRLKDPKFIGFLSSSNVVDYNISEPELTEVLLKLYRSVRRRG